MLSKAERQRNALLAEREAECRRLRMEAARYRAALQWVLDEGFQPDNQTPVFQVIREALAAAEREPSEPETIDLMVALKESIDAEREPSEAQSLEPGSQPEKEHDDQKHADDCPDDVVHRRHGRMIAHGD
jgi:hypothetical protein